MRATTRHISKLLAVGLISTTFGLGCSGKEPASKAADTPATKDSPAANNNTSTTTESNIGTATKALAFSSTQQVCGSDCQETSYSIASLRELHVYGLWKGLTGDHVELRKYFSPDGSLYYQKLVAFSTDPEKVNKPFEPTAALPHTLNVQPIKANADGQQVVWDYLPVGGTWITQHHMVGTWRVEIYLDKTSGTPDVVKTFTLNDSTSATSSS